MMLLIDIDRDKSTGWEGYDYAVNRKAPVGNEAMLERSRREWSWSEVGKVTFRLFRDENISCNRSRVETLFLAQE